MTRIDPRACRRPGTTPPLGALKLFEDSASLPWLETIDFGSSPWRKGYFDLIILILDSNIYSMLLTEILPLGRWKLLKALWADGLSASIQALARQNGMSYSSAHAELKRLEQAMLARSRVVGNSHVFEANKDHRMAGAVEELVRASADAQPTDEFTQPAQIMANLASLGAPVQTETQPAADLVPEEAIAQGLRMTHRSPTLARAYPVLLARNRDRLNLDRLRQEATALNEKQTLGFFLELTGTLASDRHLRSFAQTLRDRRVRRVRDFFEGPHGKYSRELANRRTPQVAKDWHFRMNMDMDNFRTFYSKFHQA